MKKKIKAKLIADGGFYQIIMIDKIVPKIDLPVMRKIKINTPEIDFSDIFIFSLKFAYRCTRKGYAEYYQYDAVRIEKVI